MNMHRSGWVVVCGVLLGSLALAERADGQAAPPRLPREDLLVYRGTDGATHPVRTTADWQNRRAEILAGMQAVMGPLPGKEKRCPLDVKIEEEVDCGKYVRRLITYASEPGSRVPAYLLIPTDLLKAEGGKRAPGILALHGTDNVVGHGTVVGLGNRPNRQYAAELAERGYVVLAPNYPLLAKYQPDVLGLGWKSGTLKAVWDNMRGLDLLSTLPYVKPGGFGAIGHSLGGHNSVYTALFDDRIKAVVSSCGLDSYLDYYNGDPKRWEPEQGWAQTRYMPRMADYRGRLADIPFDFHEMIGALAPRDVLIVAPLKDANFRAESVDRVVAAAQPVFALHEAKERLRLEHPDCEHDFPPEMREKAYALFDAVLVPEGKKSPTEFNYVDARTLDVEGQGWTEVKSSYDRLPAKAEGVVRKPVWGLARNSAGLCVRFRTDAPSISARWTLTSNTLALPHMPATGVSGLDLYMKADDGRWRWVGAGRPEQAPTNTAPLVNGLPAGKHDFLLYLPLYNGVKSLEIGVPEGRTIEKSDPRPEDRRKPIVFYGTSITQGGCASRPGAVFTAIIGRALDHPVINLGFSGNGRMEPELADLLCELDPAVYVLDCVGNMNAPELREKVAPFVRTLRKARPKTPIVLAEDRFYSQATVLPNPRRVNDENHAALREAFDALVAEGVSRVYYVPAAEMLSDDGEGTVDGSHPTDLGFAQMARTYGAVIAKALRGEPNP